MALIPHSSCFQLSLRSRASTPHRPARRHVSLPMRRCTTASLCLPPPALGISETFSRLKKQGKASTRRALANGTTLRAIISMLEEVVPQLSCPIALFSYYDPILKYNVGRFISDIKDGGVHGLIVPNLPFEEIGSLKKEAIEKNIDLVLLTTPITPTHQMKEIVNASEGFVYLVSSTGVTGVRSTVNSQVQLLLKEIKEKTSKPVAVGFGISKVEHVKKLSSWGADGVIVGSAIVKLLGEAKTSEEGLRHVETFTRSLKHALP